VTARKKTHRASGKKSLGWKFSLSEIPTVLGMGLDQLAQPAHEFSERVEPRGELMARFVMHLDHCRVSENRMQVKQAWQYAKHKTDVRYWMMRQHTWPRPPLEGRPLVRCIRFSPRRPDRLAHWSKVPVDFLCPPKMRNGKRIAGMGIIAGDSPELAHVVQFWEPAVRGKGFVFIEVWTNE